MPSVCVQADWADFHQIDQEAAKKGGSVEVREKQGLES